LTIVTATPDKTRDDHGPRPPARERALARYRQRTGHIADYFAMLAAGGVTVCSPRAAAKHQRLLDDWRGALEDLALAVRGPHQVADHTRLLEAAARYAERISPQPAPPPSLAAAPQAPQPGLPPPTPRRRPARRPRRRRPQPSLRWVAPAPADPRVARAALRTVAAHAADAAEARALAAMLGLPIASEAP
jgi:hypothetical protein